MQWLERKGARGQEGEGEPFGCVDQVSRNHRVGSRGSLLMRRWTIRLVLLGLGWLLFAFVVQRASLIEENGLTYDPFKILGIATVRALRA